MGATPLGLWLRSASVASLVEWRDVTEGRGTVRHMAARTIHPFPARMAPEIALDCIPKAESGRARKILDPMCGSGTVLSVAVQRGHHATGVDLDPLAILMTRVATSPLDTSKCDQLREEVVKTAQSDRDTGLPWSDEETTSFAEYWFADHQRLQLARLSRAIAKVPAGPLRALAQIALSRTVITKAPKASLAADTSHSRPHRVVDASGYDVMAGFSRTVADLARLLGTRHMAGSAEVHLGDCRTLDRIASTSIDMVVTSPPYLNAIDYMRGHKFALIWLGYSIPELRAIRSNSIGAERALDCPAEAEVAELVARIEHEALNPSQLPRAILERYSHDLLRFAKQMQRVLKPEARLIAVVGNSSLRGNFIRNDYLVERALHHYGFATESSAERPLPESKRYLPITASRSSAITRRMRTETILQLIAPG